MARSLRWWAGREGGRGRARGRSGGGTVAPAAARCCSLRSSSPERARRRRRRWRRGPDGMRRYLRLVVLCLACGFCSLLYAFSQLAVSLEEGAGGGGGKPQAAAASWLGGGGRGAARGAGSAGQAAHPGRSDRYERFPVGGLGRGAPSRGSRFGRGCTRGRPAPPATGPASPASLLPTLTPFARFPPSPHPGGEPGATPA